MSSQLGWDMVCYVIVILGVPAVGSTIAVSSSTSAPAQTPSALVVASSSGTTSTTSAVLASAPKLPSEITGKTVEEIIKEWNAELQERTGKFRKQANAIAEWDRRILQNRDILLKLESEVAKVVETQGSLERQLELIETHQDEVDKALQSMEEEAERIYREERGLLLDDDAASTRDAMYEQAELIERELEQMTEHIKSIISTLNASHGGELEAADGMTPLDVVVRILNNQLSSLMWIDEKAEEFSARIQKLASEGSAADRELTGPKLWLT
ncbi:UNVERIFIED_CONTAM: Nuclear pore complex protein NUP62 [Sesamum indicum]